MEPVFEKILRQTDIQGRLSFPTGKLNVLPFEGRRNEVEFDAYYGIGVHPRSRYSFCCRTRQLGQYEKPTIYRGWSDVVREKELQVGDVLKFYKQENHHPLSTPYYIEVYRQNAHGDWSLIP